MTTNNPQPLPLTCRLGLHRWSIWGAKFTIPRAAYHFEFQQRTCLRCGRIHQRTL